jgi:hypothetical protein
MKIILTLKGDWKRGDRVFYGRLRDLFMIKLFRFCAIFIPAKRGVIAWADVLIHRIKAARIRRAMKPDLDAWDAATHRIEGWTNEDGSINVDEWTNDDQDQGTPNESAEWHWRARDRESFLKRAGKSRTGVSGVRVFVSLDGGRI